MYKINDILLKDGYGIEPGRVPGEGIALRGCFDLPKRIGDISHSWGDEDGVEPFTDVDEIFLGGRELLFHGIMIGDAATIKSNLDHLKNAISQFVDVVPFESPYGTFCVYVKRITTKNFFMGTIILIDMVEPILGASCGLNNPPTVYYSAEYSDTAVRNNCDEGYHGTEVTLTAEAGQFTSTISQAAADQLAIDWVLQNVQDYANINGECEINPTVYYNTYLEDSLQRNDCPSGYQGSTYTYSVPAYTYSSLISQEDADAQAQAELDANLTQAIANAEGTCDLVYYNEEVTGEIQKDNCAAGYIGSIEVYTVPAGTHSTIISQEYANALAQADFNQNAQDYANEEGVCYAYVPPEFSMHHLSSLPYWHWELRLEGLVFPGYKYVMRFENINGGSGPFNIFYEAQLGDAIADVIQGLVDLIENTTEAEWEALSGANVTIKPFTNSVTSTSFRIKFLYSEFNLHDVWVTQ